MTGSQLFRFKIKKVFSKETFCLCFLVLLSLFINIINLSNIPFGFHGDEAEQALQAINIFKGDYSLLGFGWYGLPISSFLVQGLFLKLLGQNIFAARFSSVFFGSLTIVPFYFLAKQIFGRRTAFFSTLLLATSHWWIAFSRLGLNNIQVAFFAVLTFYFFVLGFKKKNNLIIFLSGFILGFSPYLYFAARLNIIIILWLFLAFFFNRNYSFRKFLKMSMVFLIGLFISSLPIIFSIYNSPEIAFSRQNDVFVFGDGLASKWRQSVYGDAGLIKVIVGQFRRSFNLNSSWRDFSGQYGYQGRVLDFLTIGLLVLGFFKILFFSKKLLKFFPFIWFFLIIFFGWILTENPPFSPRVVGALPPLFLVVGYGASNLFSFLKKKTSFNWSVFLLGLVLVVIVNQNIFTYFFKINKEEWGDPNKYTATKVGYFLRNFDQNYKAVFLTAPFFYSDFGPIKFLVTNINREAVAKPSTFNPIKDSKTIYVIHPNYDYFIENLVLLNPSGSLYKEINYQGKIQVFYFVID